MVLPREARPLFAIVSVQASKRPSMASEGAKREMTADCLISRKQYFPKLTDLY